MTATLVEHCVNGTWYDERTDPNVVHWLEQFRTVRRNERIIVEYGNGTTGESWGDTEVGYIGRSTGIQKIPLIVHNSRSLGGPAILTHCIVRIATTRNNVTVWEHPRYHERVGR